MSKQCCRIKGVPTREWRAKIQSKQAFKQNSENSKKVVESNKTPHPGKIGLKRIIYWNHFLKIFWVFNTFQNTFDSFDSNKNIYNKPRGNLKYSIRWRQYIKINMGHSIHWILFPVFLCHLQGGLIKHYYDIYKTDQNCIQPQLVRLVQ